MSKRTKKYNLCRIARHPLHMEPELIANPKSWSGSELGHIL